MNCMECFEAMETTDDGKHHCENCAITCDGCGEVLSHGNKEKPIQCESCPVIEDDSQLFYLAKGEEGGRNESELG